MNPYGDSSSSQLTSELSLILNSFSRDRRNLIPIIQDVQENAGYVTPQAVNQIAAHLNLSPHEVFGVATFFSQFRFSPPGKHCLKVCQGTACHVRGSGMLIDQVARALHIQPGQTTIDQQFSLERVMCVGSCALAPVVVSDEVVRGRMTQKKLEKLLSQTDQGSLNDARDHQAAGKA